VTRAHVPPFRMRKLKREVQATEPWLLEQLGYDISYDFWEPTPGTWRVALKISRQGKELGTSYVFPGKAHEAWARVINRWVLGQELLSWRRP